MCIRDRSSHERCWSDDITLHTSKLVTPGLIAQDVYAFKKGVGISGQLSFFIPQSPLFEIVQYSMGRRSDERGLRGHRSTSNSTSFGCKRGVRSDVPESRHGGGQVDFNARKYV